MNPRDSTHSLIARVNDANQEIFSLLKYFPRDEGQATNLTQRNSELQAELSEAHKILEALQCEVQFSRVKLDYYRVFKNYVAYIS